MSGRVVLVGAGPGDPGLLTLRGREWLAAADVVVCDYLVHGRLLEAVRPEAEVIRVGSSHGDPHRLSQQAIEALLIARAREGKLVVRLKNGDPFLFGRGGEEATALRAAAVPFEVVSGVTSALAVPAWAGIPVTHRAHASLVTIATGHQAATPDVPSAPPQLPWELLARLGGTLVFLMGIRHLEAILERLLAGGLDPAMPAAVVERGTLGTQRTVVATAATLAEQARTAAVRAPAVLVIGRVVELREQVAWVTDRPLLGRRIVVTRPRDQAPELARLLEACGAEVLVAPTIVLDPPVDPAPLERAVAAADAYDWIVFTSANGVRAFFARYDAPALPVFTVGQATAQVAHASGFRTVVSADGTGEDLADLLARRLHPDDGAILHPAAETVSFSLAAALEPLGFEVREIAVYRALVATELPPTAVRALSEHSADGILFFSVRTAAQFVTLAQKAKLQPALVSVTAFALSDQIARALRIVRWRTVRIAERPDLGGLLDAVDQSQGL
ncbi:MAG: uroporphyrinogen-III C-methyltransferase [bacterium]|nr:uroporphyrinogen-III C-methyltransferase [bacterium]